MVSLIPPPEPRELLPPFLACLPTAFVSTRPPPALLPLLSPILRQRVQLLSTTSSASTSDSWLNLLCWNRHKAERLPSIIEKGSWESHPVSGQIEIEDPEELRFKRFDEETLRTQVSLPDYDLTILYVWCADDQGGSGWRVTELVPYDRELSADPTWSSSISEANSSSSDRILSEAIRDAENAEARRNANLSLAVVKEDDDDDYWAQYDRTPGRTPAPKHSPAPQTLLARTGPSEDDYYARYAEVQPAMDPTDPSEEETAGKDLEGQTTLNGNTLAHLLQRQSQTESSGRQTTFHEDEDEDGIVISQPQPSRSPSSTAGSDTIERLEQSATVQSDSEVAVKQHVSTTLKSIYRLARSTGMEREEFKRIVQRELDVLELLD